MQKAGFEHLELDLPAESRLDMVVSLGRVSDVVDVTGHVIDAGGAPVAGASVTMGHEIELTDADGAFTIHWSAEEARGATFSVQREDGVWAKEELPLHIVAVKRGHLPTRLDLEEADLGDHLVLRLGGEPLAISGRVVDDDGEPLAGIGVWARDLTRLGNVVLREGKAVSRYETTVEERLRDKSAARGAITAEDGTFVLPGLLDRDYDIQVFDTATSLLGTGWVLAAGSDDVELVLATGGDVERVAGRVISAGGEPIANATSPCTVRPGRGPPGAAPRSRTGS